MKITFETVPDALLTILAEDGIEVRQMRTLEEVERFVGDRGPETLVERSTIPSLSTVELKASADRLHERMRRLPTPGCVLAAIALAACTRG